jgi:chromosome segregation ATPase
MGVEMTDTNEGTTQEAGEAQVELGETPAASDTPDFTAEVTTLRSRNAGLDAKVTELSKSQKALTEETATLKASLTEAQKGVVDKDEALRAQLQAKDDELTAVRREIAMTKVQSQYPEAFAELGDAAAALEPEKLAALEARLSGATDSGEPPRPQGANPGRAQSAGPKAVEDMSLAELETHLQKFDRSVMGLS